MTTVYVCSNPACRAAWSADPGWHCPACKGERGGAWSCLAREVRELPVLTDAQIKYMVNRVREWNATNCIADTVPRADAVVRFLIDGMPKA